jgi:hypothetical protein
MVPYKGFEPNEAKITRHVVPYKERLKAEG